MATTRPNFGIDAPPVIITGAVVALAGLILLVLPVHVSGLPFLVAGIATVVLMVLSSRRGKIIMRERVLDGLQLRDSEAVLDMGCGSGLMLLGAVGRGTHVTGVGIDLWRSVDQAGSNRHTCLANAELLGVRDRVTLVDGDMSELPMDDDSVDVVMACLAIHNIHDSAKRGRAVSEAARVLRPGGRMAIIDFTRTAEYAESARAAGFEDVQRSRPSLRMFPPVRVVTARMPAIPLTPEVDGEAARGTG